MNYLKNGENNKIGKIRCIRAIQRLFQYSPSLCQTQEVLHILNKVSEWNNKHKDAALYWEDQSFYSNTQTNNTWDTVDKAIVKWMYSSKIKKNVSPPPSLSQLSLFCDATEKQVIKNLEPLSITIYDIPGHKHFELSNSKVELILRKSSAHAWVKYDKFDLHFEESSSH